MARRAVMLLAVSRRRDRVSLAILLALVVLWAQAPVVHDHGTEGLGLYDDECTLAKCALGSSGLPPIGAVGGSPLPTTEVVVPTSSLAIGLGITSPFAARAPPEAASARLVS